MPRYALTPDASGLPAILPFGVATGSPGIGVIVCARTEGRMAKAAIKPRTVREQRVVGGDFVMVLPPGRKIVGRVLPQCPRYWRCNGLDQRGMSRIEDGKVCGIFPKVCSAACIATIYPYGPSPAITAFTADENFECLCSSSRAWMFEMCTSKTGPSKILMA